MDHTQPSEVSNMVHTTNLFSRLPYSYIKVRPFQFMYVVLSTITPYGSLGDPSSRRKATAQLLTNLLMSHPFQQEGEACCWASGGKGPRILPSAHSLAKYSRMISGCSRAECMLFLAFRQWWS